jgi:hypothetical protein
METHIAGQVRTLTRLGHRVFLAVSALDPGSLPPELAAKPLMFTQGRAQRPAEILDAVSALVDFARREQVSVVHCHTLVSALTACLAASAARLPFIYTIHGASQLKDQHPAYDLIIRGVVHRCAWKVFCVSRGLQTWARSISAANYAVLPNGVALPPAPVGESGGAGRWAVASRITAPKLGGILDFLGRAKTIGIESVDILGEGKARGELEQFVSARARELPEVNIRGWVYQAESQFAGYAGIAGMSRVVLEGAVVGKPVMLVGYEHVLGLLSVDTIERAAFWNFTGMNLKPATTEELAAQMKDLKRNRQKYILRDWVAERLDETKIWTDYVGALEGARPADPRWCEFIIDALHYLGDAEHLHPTIDRLVTDYARNYPLPDPPAA